MTVPLISFIRVSVTNEFLAAMTSTRSDDVFNFVCLCVCSHFVMFGVFNLLKGRCFKGVTRVSPGCLKEVSREFQVCLKGVFQGSFKDFLRMFERRFKSVSSVLPECFIGVF